MRPARRSEEATWPKAGAGGNVQRLLALSLLGVVTVMGVALTVRRERRAISARPVPRG